MVERDTERTSIRVDLVKFAVVAVGLLLLSSLLRGLEVLVVGAKVVVVVSSGNSK